MDQQDLATAKYVALTTYKRDGTPVSNPMWINGADGSYEMMTSDASWKVKRLRNNPAVTLRVSDMKGRVDPGAALHEGTAVIVAGAEADEVVSRLRDKYGLAAKLIGIQQSVLGFLKRAPKSETVGIRITLD